MARGPSRRDPGFRVIVALTDQFTGPINRVNRSIAEATAKVRAIAAVPGAIARASGLDKIGGAVRNLGGAVGNLRGQIAGALAPFTRLLAIGGGVGLVAMTTNAIKLGDELIKLSTISGLSVEGIQRLQYAAKQSGVSAEAMTGSFTRLHKAIAAGRSGDKEMVKVFAAMKLSIDDLKNLAPDEVFLRVADRISAMTDPTHKAAAAMKIFGKSGTELLPVLNEGAAGIRKLGDELAATGGIMSADVAKQAKAFNDLMLKMQQYLQGVAFAVLEKLLPAMTDGAKGMDDWLAANREWLTTEIVSVINDIVAGAKAFGAIIGDVIGVARQLSPVWDAVVAVLGKGNTILLAFTAVVAPGIIGALYGIIKAVVALGVSLVANPIGALIIAVVAVIAGAAYLIWKHWDDIVAAFEWAWDQVSSAFDTGLAAIEGAWQAVVNWFDDTITDVSAWIDRIIAPLGQLAEAIKAALTGPLDWIKAQWDALVAFFDRTIGRITGLFSSIGGAISSVSGAVGGAASGAGSWIGRQFGGGGKGASGAPAMPQMQGVGGGTESRTEMDVRFHNMPPGTDVSHRSSGSTDFNFAADGGGLAPAGAY